MKQRKHAKAPHQSLSLEEADHKNRLEMWRLGSSLVADDAQVAGAGPADNTVEAARRQPDGRGHGTDSCASSPDWLSECYSRGESESGRA